MYSLDEIKLDFEAPKESKLLADRKDRRFATMMSILESNFNIRVMGSNEGNTAYPLYMEIAKARTFREGRKWKDTHSRQAKLPGM